MGGNGLNGSNGGDSGKLSGLEGCCVRVAPAVACSDGLGHEGLQEGVGNGLEGENCFVSCRFAFLPPRPPPIKHFLLVVWDE